MRAPLDPAAGAGPLFDSRTPAQRSPLSGKNIRRVLINAQVGGPVPTANPKRLTGDRDTLHLMSELCRLIWCALDRPVPVALPRCKPKSLFFDISSMCFGGKTRSGCRLSNIDRLVFAGLYRLAPGMLDALKIVTAGDGNPLAPGWISIILALEIQAARRETERPAGDPRS